MPLTRTILMEELQQYFTMPEKAVAKHLGICLTSLKKICRQNGIHRWPYRKVKSMDKKMRKLEATGGSSETSSITDDGLLDGLDDGVLCALGSDINSPPGDLTDFESSSEAGEATASSATTPRGIDFNPSTVSSPLEFGAEEPTLQTFTVSPGKSSAFEAVPVKMSKATAGQPIKMEISLPPDMLKQMANGAQNITFTIQGVDSNGTHVHLSSESMQQASQPEEVRTNTSKKTAVPARKSQPVKEESVAMSDDDIIAMLAGCAAPCKPRHESFADIVRDKSGAASSSDAAEAQSTDTSCLEPSDAELMAALAGCCGVQNPFNPGYDEDHHHHHAEEIYHADHDVLTWGSGDSMEDILGEDCH